jgi:hypothetical protein
MRWPTWHSAEQLLAAKNTVMVTHPWLLVISHFQDLNHRYEDDICRMSLKLKKKLLTNLHTFPGSQFGPSISKRNPEPNA